MTGVDMMQSNLTASFTARGGAASRLQKVAVATSQPGSSSGIRSVYRGRKLAVPECFTVLYQTKHGFAYVHHAGGPFTDFASVQRNPR